MQANLQTYNSSQELEDARALEAAASTYTERFYTLMRLISVSAMIKNAKIISSPSLPGKTITGKKAAGRPRDLSDIEYLEKIRNASRGGK